MNLVDSLLLRSLALILVLFSLCAGATESIPEAGEHSVAATPDWVLPADYDSSGKLEARQASQYLLVDEQVNLVTEEYYFHHVVRPLTNDGVEEVSELHVDFNPAYQGLSLHSIQVKRNGKTREVVDSARVRIVQQEKDMQFGIQDGVSTAIVILEDVAVGDIVEYSYTLAGRNPIFSGKAFGFVPLNWRVEVDRQNIRILAPAGTPLYMDTVNASDKLEKTRQGSYDQYQLQRNSIAAVFDEGEYPPSYTPYAYIQYTVFASWEEVADWAVSLYEVDTDPSGRLADTIQLLKEKSSNKEDYLLNALNFVQNEIRYLGLEFGMNSHKPREPGLVLERRYGDCKDKSLLLNTLLSAAGIDAWPALVSASYRDGIGRDLPGPGSFDHVISHVELEGEKYWLDPTRAYQGGRLGERAIHDYGLALVVREGSKKLVDMYPGQQIGFEMKVEEQFSADGFDDGANYTIKSTYIRNFADHQRQKFHNLSHDEIQRNYLELAKKFYPDIRVSAPLEYKDFPEENRFVVTEHYNVGDIWDRDGHRISSNFYEVSFADTLREPKVRQRTGPYYLGEPVKIEHQTSFTYPEDVGLYFPEETTSLENEYLSYEFSDSYEGRVYTHEASLRIKNGVVQAGDVAEFIELAGEIKSNWDFNISFNEPGAVPGYRELLRLKSKLKELAN